MAEKRSSRGSLSDFLKFTVNAPVSRISMLLGWAAVLISLSATYHPLNRETGRDFIDIYAGSNCLITHCLPYDPSSLEKIVEREGFSADTQDWPTTLPVYPPPTLVLVAPLAMLSLMVAEHVMYLLTLVSLLCACYVVYVRSSWLAGLSPAIRGILFGLTLHAPKMRFALLLGNPAPLCFALVMFCCFDTSENTRWRRAILFSIACVLKPQFALPMILVLAIKPQDGWPTVRRVIISLTSFTTFALAWFHVRFGTAAWLAGLRGNLALAYATSLSPTDHTTIQSTRLNLEYLIGYWIPQATARGWITAGLLLLLSSAFLLGIWRVRRRMERQSADSPQLLMLTIACVAVLTLLPVYHAFYDGAILLLVLPWAIVALHQRVTNRAAAISLLFVALTYSDWVRRLPERIRGIEGVQAPYNLAGFLSHRTESLEALALCLILIATLLYEGSSVESWDVQFDARTATIDPINAL